MFITILGSALFGVALIIYLLPVGQCEQCPHCRVERLRQKAATVRAVEFCPLCRKQHGPGDGDHDR